MNERYIFRGRRIDNGEWVYGHYAFHPSAICGGVHRIYLRPKDPDDLHGYFYVDSATIGQCTKLKDKNGELIFEGDILRYKTGASGSVDGYVSVSWSNGAWVIELTKDDKYHLYQCLTSWELEVIGTLHDTPELERQAMTNER